MLLWSLSWNKLKRTSLERMNPSFQTLTFAFCPGIYPCTQPCIPGKLPFPPAYFLTISSMCRAAAMNLMRTASRVGTANWGVPQKTRAKQTANCSAIFNPKSSWMPPKGGATSLGRLMSQARTACARYFFCLYMIARDTDLQFADPLGTHCCTIFQKRLLSFLHIRPTLALQHGNHPF